MTCKVLVIKCPPPLRNVLPNFAWCDLFVLSTLSDAHIAAKCRGDTCLLPTASITKEKALTSRVSGKCAGSHCQLQNTSVSADTAMV